jgi:hypothetical protein
VDVLSDKSYLEGKLALLAPKIEAPEKEEEALCSIIQPELGNLKTTNQVFNLRLKKERNKENH